jgi:tripartite ATP-independent transporter DctP family solute receptor
MRACRIVFALALVCAAALSPSVSAQTAMKMNISVAQNSHYGVAIDTFAKEVEARTKRRYKIQTFYAGALGAERESVEGVQLGTLDLTMTSTGPLPNFVPEVAILDIPFLFRDYAHARAVLDGPIGQEMLQKFPPKGMVALAWGENGFRHMTNSKRPVNVPDDLKGLKMRTMENPIHIQAYKQFGILPTPMAFTEVFTALQQGTVDGQENPLSVITAAKLDQVQKNLSLTGHVYSPAVILMNKGSGTSCRPPTSRRSSTPRRKRSRRTAPASTTTSARRSPTSAPRGWPSSRTSTRPSSRRRSRPSTPTSPSVSARTTSTGSRTTNSPAASLREPDSLGERTTRRAADRYMIVRTQKGKRPKGEGGCLDPTLGTDRRGDPRHDPHARHGPLDHGVRHGRGWTLRQRALDDLPRGAAGDYGGRFGRDVLRRPISVLPARCTSSRAEARCGSFPTGTRIRRQERAQRRDHGQQREHCNLRSHERPELRDESRQRTRATTDVTNSRPPTGGVIIPIVRLTMTMIPN